MLHWRAWAGLGVVVSTVAVATFACTGSDPDAVPPTLDSGSSGSNGTSSGGTSGSSGTSGLGGDSGPSLDCKPTEVPCGTSCVDTVTNHDNCGKCSNACGADFQCSNGHCANEPTDLALGFGHTCASLSGGQLWCWGGNDSGERGLPRDAGSTPDPTPVPGLTDVARVFIGGNTTCIIKTTTNLVYCWGGNNGGVAGHDPKIDDEQSCSANAAYCNTVPRKVVIPTTPGLPSVDLHADELIIGAAGTCARQLTNDVMCWGHRVCGDFGDGDAGQILNDPYSPPRLVPTLTNVTHLARASTRMTHFCALKDDKTVVCWGDNTYGQCGSAPTATNCTTSLGSALFAPTPVLGLADVSDLAVGSTASCAVSGTEVKCWGSNENGIVDPTMLSTTTIPAPTKVAITGTPIKVAVGDTHACALLADNSVVCWGRHSGGSIGDEEPVMDAGVSSPVAARSAHASSIALGPDYSGALGIDHKVLLWGTNSSGKLGETGKSALGQPTSVTKMP